MDDYTKQFELSIWRPARFGRVIEYLEHAAGEFDRAHLLEQIYTWDPGPMSPWISVLDGQKSSLLRDSFIEKFAPNLPPHQRTVGALSDFTDFLRKTLAEPNSSSWNSLFQKAATNSGEAPLMRCDLAQALLLHLEWIIATFLHVPGASVTVR